MASRIGKMVTPITLLAVVLLVLSSTNYSRAGDNKTLTEPFPWTMFLPSITSIGGITESCIIGEWIRLYDWSCDWIDDSVIDQINADHTWTSDGGSNGTWSLSGNTFTYFYPNGTTYVGRVNPTCASMSGTMTYPDTGMTGCWSATKSQ